MWCICACAQVASTDNTKEMMNSLFVYHFTDCVEILLKNLLWNLVWINVLFKTYVALVRMRSLYVRQAYCNYNDNYLV